MSFEYDNNIRDKKTIALKANQTLRDRTLQQWKDGTFNKYVGKRGYMMVKTPNGIRYEHHVVWIKNTGIPVHKGIVIHHINGDRLDNNFQNLCMMPVRDHHQLHYSQRNIGIDGRLLA